MKVKICGITTTGIASQVAVLKPDYMGFVFAKSKRQIDPLGAARIIESLQAEPGGSSVQYVGVFGRTSEQELSDALKQVPLHAVQFHLPEDVAWIPAVRERYGVDIWVTVPIAQSVEHLSSDGAISEKLQAGALAKVNHIKHAISGLLLDTHDPVHGGGSGKSFRWELIPLIAEQIREMDVPLYAAGGLTADNVASLLQYPVDGVDVSSGVETNGVKDIEKVKQFIERVRSHDQSSTNLSIS